MQRYNVKLIKWNEDKNQLLKDERGISFEDIELAVSESRVVKVDVHYNQDKYSNQKVLYALIRDYIYVVPFVESDDEIFFKTIIPSIKHTKLYHDGNL